MKGKMMKDVIMSNEKDFTQEDKLLEVDINTTKANHTEREHLQAWLADFQQRQGQLVAVQQRLAWLDGWLTAIESHEGLTAAYAAIEGEG